MLESRPVPNAWAIIYRGFKTVLMDYKFTARPIIGI